MAEAFLNHLAGARFEAESAGIEPGELNPFAVEAMREEGIDISRKPAKSVFDLRRENRQYQHVITVCDAAAGVCPVFPGFTATAHWPFDDPAGFTGTDAEKLEKTRRVRDAVRKKIETFIAEQQKEMDR
jgi:arsenate reductase